MPFLVIPISGQKARVKIQESHMPLLCPADVNENIWDESKETHMEGPSGVKICQDRKHPWTVGDAWRGSPRHLQVIKKARCAPTETQTEDPNYLRKDALISWLVFATLA